MRIKDIEKLIEEGQMLIGIDRYGRNRGLNYDFELHVVMRDKRTGEILKPKTVSMSYRK